MKTYPLSQTQEGILLACRQQPTSTCYNLPCVLPFPKEVEAGRLQEALKTVIALRPVLHTRLVETDNGLVRQYADTDMPIDIPLLIMTEQEAHDFISCHFVRPFDLFGAAPLCRFMVIETPEHTWLLTDFHHIIADGITIAHCLMGRDLPAAYDGEPLPEEETGLYEQAEAEQNVLGSAGYERARDYYHRLFGEVDFTVLPSDLPGGEGEDIVVSRLLKREEIDDWCMKCGVSTHLLFMAAYSIVTAKLSHGSRVAFATLSHGRTNHRLRESYGMFVRTVPVMVDVRAEERLSDLIGQLRRTMMASVRNAAYPYTHFCRDLQKNAVLTFAFQSDSIPEQVSIGPATVRGIQLGKGRVRNNLSCVVYAHPSDYELRMDASEACLGKPMLELFADTMATCLRFLMDNPDKTIGEVEIVDEAGRQEILSRSRGERVDYDKEKTVIQLFLEQTAQTPQRVAVSDGKVSLTYAQLDTQTAALTGWLSGRGVGEGDFVGVEAEPCAHFLTAVLAVMRTGAAYVPLDPTWPLAYRQHILEETGIRQVLNPLKLPKADDTVLGNFDNLPTSSHTAYMIYTSGTTGVAKGVMIPHSALAHLIRFIVRHWPVNADSRISCHSSLCFDASVEDLFPALTVGGTVFVMPENVRRDPAMIHQFIDEHAITGGCYTTQMGPLLATRHHSTLAYICLGGERLVKAPDVSCRVYNTYGPTEYCVDATWYELEKAQEQSVIPIGRPLDNTLAVVVDQYGRLLPQGAVGELLLVGPQLAEGYWREPELTAWNFTRNPYGEGRCYRTGDLVRWNSEWQLEFVGRKDHVVKVSGHRVNLDEIEQLIACRPHIRAVCVVARPQDGRLCAYYEADGDADYTGLADSLRENHPAYMIPSLWIRMEQLPRNSNGKTDRNRLTSALSRRTTVAAPADPLERLVCDAFSKTLSLDVVDVDDDFFTLGGTSLMAMSLLAELERAGITATYGWLFDCPTPKQLARRIAVGGDDAALSIKGDYNFIDQWLMEAPWPDTPLYTGGTQGPVLLTGATGFLGIHLLQEYLLSSSATIFCLVRGHTEEEARRRLIETYAYYFGCRFPDYWMQRVRVIAGDLTHPDCMQVLQAHRYEMVVNCAANVRHFARAGQLKAVNTDAVAALATLCGQMDCRLVQVSTMGVAGFSVENGTKPARVLNERSLYVGQRIGDAYTHSKFMAERLLLTAVTERKLDARVMRVGNLSPRVIDGRYQRNASENALHNFLKLCIRLGCMPHSATQVSVDVSPVDVVAKAVLQLALLPDGPVVAHVVNPHRCTLQELLARKEKDIIVVDDEVFMKRVCTLPTDDALLPMAYSASAFSAIARTGRPVETDCSLTADLLAHLGVVW